MMKFRIFLTHLTQNMTKICELDILSHFGSLSSDVVCMLPTGYGKSLVYELHPVF